MQPSVIIERYKITFYIINSTIGTFMTKYNFSKLMNSKLLWAIPVLYFIVYSIIIYRFLGTGDMLFFIAEGALIVAMFWGFLGGFRIMISIVIFFLIFIHFLIGNVYTSALFLITPFLLFNLRNLGALAIIGLILLIPYTLMNSDKNTWKTSRTEMAKLYSSILFNYPEYKIYKSSKSILFDMIDDPKSLDIRLKYHIYYNENKKKWMATDGYENVKHPAYQKFLKIINKNKKD